MPFHQNGQSAVNVALLGYGFAGKVFHAPLIRSVPGLHLSAIVSSRAAEIHQDLPEAAVMTSPDAVLADPSVDLIVVATPNDTHYDLAGRALAAGKHVVVDKPFTLTSAQAWDLVHQARDRGKLLSVYHNRRWDADFLTIRGLLARGELGEVMHFESHYDRYRPVVQHRWRESGAPGSGIWFDLGAHLVDQALVLFGAPDSVSGDLARQRAGATSVDYFHVLLRYGRMRVVLHGSTLVANAVRRFEIHGTEASFVKYGMDAQEDALRRGEVPGGEAWGVDPADGVLTRWVDGIRQDRPVAMLPGNYRAFYEGIRDAIANGGPNPVPPEQPAAVMQVLEAVREL